MNITCEIKIKTFQKDVFHNVITEMKSNQIYIN